MKKEFKKKVLCLAILSATVPQTTLAAFIGVDAECTLAQAIESANSNSSVVGSTCESGAGGLDVILVPEQTIDLNNPASGEDIFLIDSEITIQSATHFELKGALNARIFRVSESGNLTIRNAVISGSRIISTSESDLKNGALIYSNGGNVSLESVTLARGSVTGTETIDAKGGAIFMNGGELSLDRTLVMNNSAGSGGAIAISNGAKLTVNKSVFGLNRSRFEGGVIFQEGSLSEANIDDSDFSKNVTDGIGGAIFAEDGVVSVEGTSLHSNVSSMGAGAVGLKDASFSSVDSMFILNSTNTHGGAILALENSSVEIRGSFFSRNKTNLGPNSDFTGGAIAISNTENANVAHSIVNSTFNRNRASKGGEVYFSSDSDSGTLEIIHSTIIADDRNAERAILISNDAQLNMSNSIVSTQGNLASLIPNEINVETLCITEQGATAVLENSLVLDGSCGAQLSGSPELTRLINFPRAAPIDVGGGHDNYYVSTRIWNNLYLKNPSYFTPVFDSPLIDAAAAAPCAGLAAAKDQRGRNREDDACDIGAVEIKEANIFVDSECSLQAAIVSASEGDDSSDFDQCESGGDLNTIRFKPNMIGGGFYDNILNSRASITRPTRIVGVSKSTTKLTSNGPIRVLPSGWLELSNATVDLNSGVEIAGYGALSNVAMVGDTLRGVFVDRDGQAVLNRTTVENSQTGIVVQPHAEALVTNSTIKNNSGGGISISESGELSLLNSTVSENSSNRPGAAIKVENATFNSIHSTISGNSSNTGGGGIYVKSSFSSADENRTEVFLQNSIISGNSATIKGNEISIAQFGTQNITFNIENNLIGDDSSSYERAIDDPFKLLSLESNNSLLTETDSSGNANPQAKTLSDVILPLRVNTGPTQTHAIPARSVAIDAGDIGACSTIFKGFSFVLDQQGISRSDELCDIGAFEYLDDDFCVVMPTIKGKVVHVCL